MEDELMYDAMREIIALQAALANALGIDQACNAVAMRLEERLRQEREKRYCYCGTLFARNCICPSKVRS